MNDQSIQFSVPDWCFFTEELEIDTYYPALKERGYEAVEMVPRSRRPAARKAGLSVLNHAAPGMEIGLNDRENHSKLIPEIRAAIREAAEDQVPHVILFSGNRVEGVSDGPDAVAEAIEQLLPYAEKTGRVLIFEMLNSYDHIGYEADNSTYGFDIAARFDSPHFKILLDLYHMRRMGEDPVAQIRDNIKHIGHLHVAGSPNRDYPGSTQELDFASCVRTARQSGYDGLWGMEFLPGDDKMRELERAVELFRRMT
jgi:hydroxypyruvate isomerase